MKKSFAIRSAVLTLSLAIGITAGTVSAQSFNSSYGFASGTATSALTNSPPPLPSPVVTVGMSSVDNLAFSGVATPVPEPGPLAILCGFALLGLVMSSRRRN